MFCYVLYPLTCTDSLRVMEKKSIDLTAEVDTSSKEDQKPPLTGNGMICTQLGNGEKLNLAYTYYT